MVAHLDLEGLIGHTGVRIQLEVGLATLTHKVERVAGVKAHSLVFRRVVDLVFADELIAGVDVPPIDFHFAFRKRHAEVRFLRVLELQHHPYLGVRQGPVFGLVADVIVVPAAISRVHFESVVDVNALGRNVRSTQELHLLDFPVQHARGSLERVEMVFLERALGHGWRCPTHFNCPRRHHEVSRAARRRLDPRHVACHQLDAGVLEVFAAHVFEGDPADDVEGVALLRRDRVVVCLPAHPAGEVGELDFVLAGFPGPKPPEQGRFQERLGVQGVENRLAGEAKLDLAVYFHDRLAATLRVRVSRLGVSILLAIALEGGSVRNVPAPQDPALDNPFLARLHGDFKVQQLPLRLAQQQAFAERIALVVLLQNADGVRLAKLAQDDRLGLQVSGDVGHADLVLAVAQLQGAVFLHRGEVLVVDRELRLCVRGAHYKYGDERQRPHVNLPVSGDARWLDGGEDEWRSPRVAFVTRSGAP